MTGTTRKKLLVFLSHASEDESNVRQFCQQLKDDGFDPWLAEERLLPGQEWSLEIEKTMRTSDAILLCFSSRSVKKESYFQREYKRALQYQEEKPEGTIFIIPVRLDQCEVPFTLHEIQWVDYPGGYERIVIALRQRARSVNKSISFEKKTEAFDIQGMKSRTSENPNIAIQGGIHADKVIFGNQINYHSGGDMIMGDQNNYSSKYLNIQNLAELSAALQQVEALVAAIKQQMDLSSVQKQLVQNAEQKVVEAASEAAKLEPTGERIKMTLAEAKEYLDVIGGSVASAATLGVTIGNILVQVAKLFGL